MVVWFIGISGAGKSTLGNMLHEYYSIKGINSFIIDGDLVREFYDNDLGYSKDDRVANIKRIMLSAYVLEKNGIIPIICNISPFEELRAFARQKFEDYREIFLKKDIQIAKNNDIKGVYQENLDKTSLVGIDMVFEEPKHSDLKIAVDNENVEASFQKLIRYLEGNE